MQNHNIVPDFPKENRLIFDWVSYTSRKHSVHDLIDLMGFREIANSFVTVRGSKGFMYRMYFNGVSIHFNEDTLNNIGGLVWVELSGQGCRVLETFGNGDYEKIFSLARSDPQNFHVTRLDIAFDDMTGIFSIDIVCDKTKNEEFVSRIKTYQSIYSNKGNSVYFGSRLSKVLIRIYDKAKERGYMDGLHWIRCELQLKDSNAMSFVEKLCESDLPNLYTGVIKNYLSFREPTRDSNKRRWPESSFWRIFLYEAAKLSLFSKPGVDYNLSRCERYVLKYPLGNIKVLIEVYGKEAFLEMVENAPMPKNPKYRMLIAQAKAEMQARSDASVLERWIELVGDNELEALAELQEGYKEVDRIAKLRYEEKKAELLRQRERKWKKREEIIAERAAELQKRYLKNNESKGDT